jgi:hypothetical protein
MLIIFCTHDSPFCLITVADCREPANGGCSGSANDVHVLEISGKY